MLFRSAAELTADARLVLDNVRELLGTKPRLSMSICSVASLTDAATAERRLELANQRAVAVRDYLLARQTIKPQRLRECLSREAKGDAKATVELVF